ncbi:hypothetical protein CANINC_000048 [Pichia inconspicua]|uniref:Uncharacterized protein n=1 Tax=Pichia inconspicua TaxID=52247 RepID=A0A4T0X8G3_9ASCO|nr:hypothetical protein CANINC_000048 [[Candida] inconspicua]
MSENINMIERAIDHSDQENADILRGKHNGNRDTKLEQASSSRGEINERAVLRSKSSNSFNPNISKLNAERPSKGNLFANLGNANKARKVMSQFSIFEPQKILKSETLGDKIRLHDSTSLKRSTSQFKVAEESKSLSKSSTLAGDLFSSSFGSSIGDQSSNSKDARKIKSQLTMTINNDMAEFFKKSKMEEQEKLGIEVGGSLDREYNQTRKDTKLLDEITFADESQDISNMKKLTTERDSPVYQRTRKVNIQNLLSSSTDDDEFGETTFDFKDINVGDTNAKHLEDLILSRAKNDSENFEIEYTSSRSANAIYDETTPDVVLEGIYKPIPKKLLHSMWSDKPLTETEVQSFEDPLSLKQTWNNRSKEDTEVFALKNEDMLKTEDFELEFSDIEEESDEKELLKLKEFYDNSHKI